MVTSMYVRHGFAALNVPSHSLHEFSELPAASTTSLHAHRWCTLSTLCAAHPARVVYEKCDVKLQMMRTFPRPPEIKRSSLNALQLRSCALKINCYCCSCVRAPTLGSATLIFTYFESNKHST